MRSLTCCLIIAMIFLYSTACESSEIPDAVPRGQGQLFLVWNHTGHVAPKNKICGTAAVDVLFTFIAGNDRKEQFIQGDTYQIVTTNIKEGELLTVTAQDRETGQVYARKSKKFELLPTESNSNQAIPTIRLCPLEALEFSNF
ncbi:MAG: hypothetical protein AAGG68_09890 [Bacteroidota bacterium]